MADLVRSLREETALATRPQAELVHVVVAPRPLSVHRVESYVSPTQTVAQIIDALHIPAWCYLVVTIDGVPLPKRFWAATRVKPGHHLFIRAVPMGGGGGGAGGGGDSNKTTRIVLMAVVAIVSIAIIAVTAGAGTPLALGLTGAAWGMIGAAAVSILGTLAITMLLPPPGPQSLNAGDQKELKSITSARNAAVPYAPIPYVAGRHKIFPPAAA